MFVPLGDLEGGAFESHGYAVSADGSTVVGYSVGASGAEPFRWTSAGGMVGLGTLATMYGTQEAFGVSGDGSVVVGTSDLYAFRWTSESGMVALRNRTSAAYAVSTDGSVAVGYGYANWPYSSVIDAFRWTSEGGITLGRLGPGQSVAHAVSADGSVVVGESGNQAFRWTSEGGIVGLGYLDDLVWYSHAYGVSADGSVVVGESNNEAFRWTSEGGMVGLGHLVPGQSRAVAASADGSVVVGVDGGAAFIWDPVNGMRDLSVVLVNDYGLDLTGWTLGMARGVSADGRTIVGTGVNPNGQVEAWLAVLPEPGTGLIAVAGALGVVALRRRPLQGASHRSPPQDVAELRH
jgi:probable HAF family extracellular repeat protein